MASLDLYRDFAWCLVTGYVGAADTAVPVDDMSRLPSNLELLAGDFWMTFESTYAQSEFEIVRLVTKTADSGPGTLTVERAQHGSVAFARQPGVILKHALTAEMLRRLVEAAQSGGGGGYKRYVDLGNFTLTGQAQCFSDPTVLRGVAAGQAGGSTVVAGILIDRGFTGGAISGQAAVTAELLGDRGVSATSSAVSTSLAELTVSAPVEEDGGMWGTSVWGQP